MVSYFNEDDAKKKRIINTEKTRKKDGKDYGQFKKHVNKMKL